MRVGEDTMGPEEPLEGGSEVEQSSAAQFTAAAEPGIVPAWEEIETGRYMPRRIKGSCKGRALG
jgi:hypothetical protein